MICMSTSLPTSTKLPNRIAGCGVPEGTCSVPCAAANDATARSATARSALGVQRFMPSSFSVFLLPVYAVHQRRVDGRADKEGGHEAALMPLSRCGNGYAPPFLVDTDREDTTSSTNKPKICLAFSEHFPNIFAPPSSTRVRSILKC